MSERHEDLFRRLVLEGKTLRAVRKLMSQEGCDLSQYSEMSLTSKMIGILRGRAVEWEVPLNV